MNISKASVSNGSEENNHLRKRVVGTTVTNAWVQADCYIFEFDYRIRIMITPSGADWFTAEVKPATGRVPGL